MKGILDVSAIKPGAKYNTTQVVKLTGLDRGTIRKYADANKLFSARGLNGRRWFLGIDIINFIKSY